ncbi:hypothetical protein D3C73_1535840 [compost metagenome]
MWHSDVHTGDGVHELACSIPAFTQNVEHLLDRFLGAAECFDSGPLYVVGGAGFVVGVEGAEYFGDLEWRNGAAEA